MKLDEIEKQRAEELKRLRAELDEFEYDLDEEWVRDCRLRYLDDEVKRTAAEASRMAQRLEDDSDEWKFFLTYTLPTKKERQEYLCSELIESYARWATEGKKTTLDEIRKMIRRHKVDQLEAAQSQAKNAYRRYGVAKGLITFEGGVEEDDIERAKSVSIKDLLIDRQLYQGGSGRVKVLCPFHTEKTPSFFIYPDNSWYCFGCHVHGQSSIDFIKKLHGFKFPEAVKFLLT